MVVDSGGMPPCCPVRQGLRTFALGTAEMVGLYAQLGMGYAEAGRFPGVPRWNWYRFRAIA